MQYVAITEGTCGWLLSQPRVAEALYDVLISGELRGLKHAEFASGPLRMAGSSDERLLAIWNKEYATGTGNEVWAIFKLNGSESLTSHPSIGKQVFERLLYVFGQRLQGLVLDGEFIHRARPNGAHTCLAGRGTETRQYSIAYFEGGPGYGSLTAKAIIAVGPEHVFERLDQAIELEFQNFGTLVTMANGLTDPARRRPLLDAPAFQDLRHSLSSAPEKVSHLENVNINTEYQDNSQDAPPAYQALYWDYTRWTTGGVLNEAQQRVLDSDALLRHPVRIIGPAGSGKTLLMQLLALRYLRRAHTEIRKIKILYIVHNSAMAQTVSDRLRTLGADEFLSGEDQSIVISTLSDYGRKLIGLDDQNVIDRDAQKTKEFQLDQVKAALHFAMERRPDIVEKSSLLKQLLVSDELFEVFSHLVMAEISTVIKGRGLDKEKGKYTDAQIPLSRLHRILTQQERDIVFECFRRYKEVVFEEFEMLDTDDLALTLEGRLRTPFWNLKRKVEGFDFVFVDEVQLFNENERRIFPYLTKGTQAHVPIALALDEAQEPFGFATAGFATLGIADVESENLPSNHRSTKEIVDLAFFVIQQTTDLFGSEFPDFTNASATMVPSDGPNASPPVVVTCNEEAKNYGRFLVKLVQKLRAKNVRQIAVICHAEAYWDDLLKEFGETELPLHIIAQRGEKMTPDQPLVVLSRPSLIGGQEFDAVVIVGLEEGLVPTRVADNPPLAAALEQQALRETYLAVSRARYRVIVTLNKGAHPNAILNDAIAQNLITVGTVS